MEDYESSLKLLEVLLPRLFEGVSDAYQMSKDANVNPHPKPSLEAINVLKNKMGFEIDLYDFVKKKFYGLKERLLNA